MRFVTRFRSIGVYQILAGATGAALGVGMGGALIAENVAAFITLPLLTIPLAAFGARFVSREAARSVTLLALLAYAIRGALGVWIHAVSLALGRGGFVTGDDSDYASISWAFVMWLRGTPLEPYVPPTWGGEDYLFGTYVYLESIMFLLFGPNVPLVVAVNAAFAGAAIIVLYELVRRLFDHRAALVTAGTIAFYPSIVLWASLNLKDALAMLLTAAVLLALHRAREVLTLGRVLLPYLLLIPMEGLRRYLFLTLALSLPVGIALAPVGQRRGTRWLHLGAAVGLTVLFLSYTGYTRWIDPSALGSLERIREAMAAGARTGYYEPPPLSVRDGHTFVVPGTRQPGPGAATSSPQVVHVRPGSRVVVAERDACPTGSACVRPGDIVVVGPPDQTAAASPVPLPLHDQRGAPSVQFAQASDNEGDDALVLTRTLAHIPRGIVFALFAPLPWQITRPADLATIPEMLAWYLVLAAAVSTLWRERRRWRALGSIVVFLTLVFGIFVLAEGNVGILFRHRGMVIPYVIALAAPTLVLWWDGLRRTARRA